MCALCLLLLMTLLNSGTQKTYFEYVFKNKNDDILSKRCAASSSQFQKIIPTGSILYPPLYPFNSMAQGFEVLGFWGFGAWFQAVREHRHRHQGHRRRLRETIACGPAMRDAARDKVIDQRVDTTAALW